MHWRWFLPFPIAAFLCGEAVRAPRLRVELPVNSECAAYERARAAYLRAYAYAGEEPVAARRFLAESERALGACGEGGTAEVLLLRVRAGELKRSLGL